ncbi:MAG: hypothetical protein P8185_02150 [Deltaproteobacteria bacterium]
MVTNCNGIRNYEAGGREKHQFPNWPAALNVAKHLALSADKYVGGFSDARSSFFVGPSILIEVLPEKTTASGEVSRIMVQSAPAN